MATPLTGVDALRWYLTGAGKAGEHQPLADASLGGFRSRVRVVSMTHHRIRGRHRALTIDYIDGNNGPGLARIEAITADTIRYYAPGDTDPGDAVTLAVGETAILTNADNPARFIEVTRTSALEFRGTETFQILDQVGGVISMRDFDAAEAAAGEAIYRAVMMRNCGPTQINSIGVWLNPDGAYARMRIASETPGGGAIQSIADEFTAPTGVTWNQGTTAGTGVYIASLAAGAEIGIWIEISCAAAAASVVGDLMSIYTYGLVGAVSGIREYRGLHGIAADTPVYRMFVKLGSEPDPDVDTPVVTGADRPLVYSGFTPSDGKYWFRTDRINEYGIRSPWDNPNDPAREFLSGAILPVKPLGPQTVTVYTTVEGKALIVARYRPALEPDLTKRATDWAVYWTADGTTPDGVGAPDAAPAMNADTGQGQEYLEQLTGAYLDGTPISALVRTSRDDGGAVYSENVETFEAVIDLLGPRRVVPKASLGRVLGIRMEEPAAPVADVTYIDEPNNVYFQHDGSWLSLYGGAVLAFAFYKQDNDTDESALYIPSDWDLVNETITGAASETGVAAEVGAWNGSKLVYLCVNSERRMVIDFTNKEIRVDTFEAPQDVIDIWASDPAWPRYAESCLQVYDPLTFNYACAGEIESGGVFKSAYDIDQGNTQAEIEALRDG